MKNKRLAITIGLAAAGLLFICALLAAAGGLTLFLGRPSQQAVVSQQPAPPETPAPTPAPPPLDPAAAIAEFDPAEPEAFLDLETLLMHPASYPLTAAEAAAHIEDTDFDARFAAIYLLVNTGDADFAPQLAAALHDADFGLRIIAAGRLIGWGEKQALPILIESLASTETLPYSDPPTPAWVLAQEALPHYTGEDFGLGAAADSAAVAATAEQWSHWWDANGDALQWNPDQKRYTQ